MGSLHLGFSGYSNPKINITESTPYEIYRNFLRDEILQLIVDKTNMFMQQFMSSRKLYCHIPYLSNCKPPLKVHCTKWQ